MRDIKFRAKRESNKEWIIGFLIKGFNESLFIMEECSYGEHLDHGGDAYGRFYKVIPETVGQFTGLKDKNGVDIYEGDIIQDADENKFVILWDSGDARFVSVNLPDYILDDESRFDEEKLIWVICKVIGSIHSNPEIIK